MKLKPRLYRLPILLSICFSVFLVIRWFYYVCNYSANVLFQDQWDLSVYIFADTPWWDLFFVQHGPHRQGLGFVITKVVASLSGWNTKTEAIVVGIIMALSGGAAVYLKKRISGVLEWTDSIILLLFVSPMHWELFTSTVNPSHGSTPLLLLILLSLSLQIRRQWICLPLVLGFDFLLVYTGFGLFAGILVPILLLLRGLRLWSKNRLLAFLYFASTVLACGILGSFFINYTFIPSNPDFSFPIDGWWHKYPSFAFCVLANLMGLKIQTVGLFSAEFAGGVFFAGMCGLVLFHLWRLMRPKGENEKETIQREVIILLTAFTLIFVINTSVGRASFGIMSTQASRYLPYLIPGALSLYLHFSTLKNPKLKRITQTMLFVVMIAATIPMRKFDHNSMIYTHDKKEQWVEIYLRTESIRVADKETGFPIYPNPANTKMKRKLEKLKKRSENLYLGINDD